MSKYIKLEDAISKIVNTPTRVITDDLNALADRQHEIIDMLADLPTIEVSEDCISRSYVRLIESDEDAYYGDWNETYEKGFIDAIDKVLNAPSVVPSCQKNRQVERAEGEWITEKDSYEIICNKCGCEAFSKYGDWFESDYCPNCGAKMKGADDEHTTRDCPSL